MKNKIVPTGRERSLTEDTYIVSKTDPKGKITYANRIFMEISGYSEADLLGVQLDFRAALVRLSRICQGERGQRRIFGFRAMNFVFKSCFAMGN